MSIEKLIEAHTKALTENTKAVNALTKALNDRPANFADPLKAPIFKDVGEGDPKSDETVKVTQKVPDPGPIEEEQITAENLREVMVTLANDKGRDASRKIIQSFGVEKLIEIPEDKIGIAYQLTVNAINGVE